MSSIAEPIACNAASLPVHYRQQRRSAVERYAFDREYVERLAQGDPDVERHFVSYFGELLLIKLRGRVRSPQAVADLRQETFLRVLKALRTNRTVSHPERFGSFVNSVCENVLLEYYRSSKGPAQMQEDMPEPRDVSSSAESELIGKERCQMVKTVLAELSDSDRKLLRRVFLEERDKDQICDELNIDRNYLRVRVHRALARFRSCVQEKGLSMTKRAGG